MHWDPRNTKKQFPFKTNGSGMETLVEGLHRAADICQDQRLQMVYHYHAGTVVETREEIDRLMEMTDPERVRLLYDTGHALYGVMIHWSF